MACRELGPGYETSVSQTTFSLRGVDRTKVKVSWLAGTLRLKHGGTSIEIMDVTSDAGAIRMHGKPGDFPLRFVLGDGRVIVWGEGYFTVDGERYETPLERGYTYAADGLLISP